jgi:hypothetical protein
MPTSPSLSAPQHLFHERALPASLLGRPGGAIGLDDNGRFSPGLLPELSHGGGLSFCGEWDPAAGAPPAANTETLANGSYFVVSAAGRYAAGLDGIVDWTAQDLALWITPGYAPGSGAATAGRWVKIDGGRRELVTVNGRRGAVTLTLGEIVAGSTYLDAGRISGALTGALAGALIPDKTISSPTYDWQLYWHARVFASTIPIAKFAAGSLHKDKVDFNWFNLPLYTEQLADGTLVPTYALPAAPDTTTKKYYHVPTLSDGGLVSDDPAAALMVAYKSGAPGAARVPPALLPGDSVFALGPRGFAFINDGPWDVSLGGDPQSMHGLGPSSRIRGAYYVVTVAGAHALPSYGGATVGGGVADGGTFGRWEVGDLALWITMNDSGGGFWAKIEAQPRVISVNGQGGDVDRALWGNGLELSALGARALFGVLEGLMTNAMLIPGTTFAAGQFADATIDERAGRASGGVGKKIADGSIELRHIMQYTLNGNKVAAGILEERHFADPFLGVSAAGRPARVSAVKNAFYTQDAFRSLVAPFVGGTTRVTNYDCEMSMPVVFPSQGSGGAVTYSAPRYYYRFANKGAGNYSTNTADGSQRAVMGSICVRFSMPLDLDSPVSMDAYLFMSTGPQSRLTMTLYNCWGQSCGTRTIAGGKNFLSRVPTDPSTAANYNQDSFRTECLSYIAGESQGLGVHPGSSITVIIECFPAPGEEVLVDRLALRWTIR